MPFLREPSEEGLLPRYGMPTKVALCQLLQVKHKCEAFETKWGGVVLVTVPTRDLLEDAVWSVLTYF